MEKIVLDEMPPAKEIDSVDEIEMATNISSEKEMLYEKTFHKKMFLESENGYFGEKDSSGDFRFGGSFVPEILHSAIEELQRAYKEIFKTNAFKQELKHYHKNFIGRPTPLIYAKNVSQILGNEIYIKFEGLANTGAHKINNALAQVLLAKKMGKTQVIAESGAGQHGLATASVCAFLKMPCSIFMGEIDIQRQQPNVFIIKQFGAKVVSVKSGTRTLKDAVNEALREWSKSPKESFYVIGSALGPYPYPDIVRDAQSIIGKEIKKQIRKAIGRLPDYIIACVGGGSNAMGAFTAFLKHEEVKLLAIEAGGEDFKKNKHAMRLAPQSEASVGIAHGYRSFFLQDSNGQLSSTHSISAGLDYAGIGPQIAHLHHIDRVDFLAASDKQALEAMQFFARHEGILAALESSHALHGVINITKELSGKVIVVNVSGRGDKDIFITAKHICKKEWKEFLANELESMKSSKGGANSLDSGISNVCGISSVSSEGDISDLSGTLDSKAIDGLDSKELGSSGIPYADSKVLDSKSLESAPDSSMDICPVGSCLDFGVDFYGECDAHEEFKNDLEDLSHEDMSFMEDMDFMDGDSTAPLDSDGLESVAYSGSKDFNEAPFVISDLDSDGADSNDLGSDVNLEGSKAPFVADTLDSDVAGILDSDLADSLKYSKELDFKDLESSLESSFAGLDSINSGDIFSIGLDSDSSIHSLESSSLESDLDCDLGFEDLESARLGSLDSHSWLNMLDSEKTKVFHTSKELSKICGKSLRS